MSEPSPKKIFENSDAKEDSDSFYHITNLRVPLYEVDLGQALYHGNYYHLFELGREDMLRKSGFPYREFLNRQLHLTITNAHCKYRKSLQYDDQIELRTAIVSLGKRGLSFSQLIYRPVEASESGRCKGPGLRAVHAMPAGHDLRALHGEADPFAQRVPAGGRIDNDSK